MKKMFLSLILIGIFSTQVYAGFWSSVAAGATVNAFSGNARNGGIPDSRLKKVNQYLWHMHEAGKYTKGYQFYLKYLEDNTENIVQLDTVAQVYLDTGNKKKALEIYEKRILPWIVIENSAKRAEYQGYYNKIKNH